MKTFTTLITATMLLLLLAACGSEKPLTEAEQAAKYGMTVERYRQEKSAAARMNMSWEEHVKTLQGGGGMEGHSM